jgi:hypothetical protein
VIITKEYTSRKNLGFHHRALYFADVALINNPSHYPVSELSWNTLKNASYYFTTMKTSRAQRWEPNHKTLHFMSPAQHVQGASRELRELSA